MAYLTDEQIEDIAKNVEIREIDEIDDISVYKFDSEIEEYNDFLYKEGVSLAKEFNKCNISRTHLFFDREMNELIGYMTLSCDTISLSRKEKEQHELQDVKFISMPSMKIGKLAINKLLTNKRKGYGSFLLEMARAYVVQMNENGVACRFITVDADVEYNKKTTDFYKKNDFIINNRSEYKEQEIKYKTISMRKDIFNRSEIDS